MMRIKIKLIILMLPCFLFSQKYNRPFIDTKETLLLKKGMTKDDVINKLGLPLYVESGDIEHDIIKWVYEVRTIKVKSETDRHIGIIPVKSNFDYRYTEPIHRLLLEFQTNKLEKWDIYIKFDISDEEYDHVSSREILKEKIDKTDRHILNIKKEASGKVYRKDSEFYVAFLGGVILILFFTG